MTRGALDRLTALVRSCATSGAPRQVLLLRLDRLAPTLRRPHHLRLADAALQPLLRAPRAELFRLPGPRWAVVWRGEADAALLEAIEALERLLDGSNVTLPDLAVLFDLPEHADLLMDALDHEAMAAGQPPCPATPLDPALLTLLETSLAQADVTRFARRRSVWRFDAPGGPELAWEERTLSVGELADGLVPGHDLMADSWLFRRLTRTLDRRMLALLASPGELNGAGPFAVELNAANVVSAEFLRFDANLLPALRGQVVVSLAPVDVVADPRAFSFASAFARAREYRLMLRLPSPDLLALLEPVLPEFDTLQIAWSEDLPQRVGGLAELHPSHRLVLSGCSSRAALSWGRAAGIGLFCGPSADAAALGERVAG